MHHAPRGKRIRKKTRQKAGIKSVSGRWPSYSGAQYAQLGSWAQDAGVFDEGEASAGQNGKETLRAMWDGQSPQAQEERARAMGERLAEAWAKKRNTVVIALLEEDLGAAEERVKRDFALSVIEELNQTLSEKGPGEEIRLGMGALHHWNHYEITKMGPDWPEISARLVAWADAVLKAAQEIDEKHICAGPAKELREDWMRAVITEDWTLEEAERARACIFGVRQDAEWSALWAKEIKSNSDSSSGNSHFLRVFGMLTPERERQERNNFQSDDFRNANEAKTELGLGWFARAPLRHGRQIVKNLAMRHKQDAPALIRRANALRPGWLRPKDGAWMIWEWMAYNDEQDESVSWGRWLDGRVRELAAALQEGCSRPIDWRAPAITYFSASWLASDIPRNSQQPYPPSLNIQSLGRRLSLAQAFWIQGNKPGLAWLKEQGVEFGVEDAKDLLDILGGHGLPMEFLGSMGEPLRKMVSEHEAQELRQLALGHGASQKGSAPAKRRAGRL